MEENNNGMTFQEWESQANYEPLNRFFNCGTEIQVCGLIFPSNVHVTERTIFPRNVFKSPKTFWVLDLVLPIEMKSDIEKFNGILSDNYYTEIGFGLPEFTNLEDAFNFNTYYNHG